MVFGCYSKSSSSSLLWLLLRFFQSVLFHHNHYYYYYYFLLKRMMTSYIFISINGFFLSFDHNKNDKVINLMDMKMMIEIWADVFKTLDTTEKKIIIIILLSYFFLFSKKLFHLICSFIKFFFKL